FFQAEDGIRDFHVTGVQTCALPIFRMNIQNMQAYRQRSFICQYEESDLAFVSRWMEQEGLYYFFDHESATSEVMCIVDFKEAQQIGRASCRERVERQVMACSREEWG